MSATERSLYGKGDETMEKRELVEMLRRSSFEFNQWRTAHIIEPINLEFENFRMHDFGQANLCNANFCRANLSSCNLNQSDLSGACFLDADLRNANLRDANLCSADLRSAILNGADLRGANVAHTKWPSPTVLLSCNWGMVSDKLCVELMRYDAANHPKPQLFKKWARDRFACPYTDAPWTRAAYFREDPALYSPGPAKSALWLAEKLLLEKCVGHVASNARKPKTKK